MKPLLDWIDSRTGYRKLTQEVLYENIPGGARWRYVWGSTLTFAFSIQVITGIFLWMAYSASAQTAWESVFYIQFEMAGGWFLRGLHHYTAQVMTILLALHLLQVLIDGAYKAPREFNFWSGLLLLQLTLALSLTGYLLPWDQKGYWATKVATNIVSIVPFIGPDLQKLVVGGPDYGHHTLTRFLALHAGVLPGLIIALIGGHIYFFRRHGIHAKQPLKKPDAKFWPDQVLADAIACLGVLFTVVVLTLITRGAELAAPADAASQFSAARPEWYFLFLFELLKYFPGESEIIGAIVLPGAAVGFMFLMPYLGQWKLGHRFNLAFVFGGLAGAGLLTWMAMKQDNNDPNFQRALRDSHHQAARVIELAKAPSGIPIAGAAVLLREDPYIQGPKLFAKHCASCHRHGGHDGEGNPVKDPQSAADLKGFASREWLAGLLDPAKVDSLHYFGGTKFKDGKMVKWVKKNADEPKEQEQLKSIIAALSAEAQLKSQRDADARDVDIIKQGVKLARGDVACTDCHAFGKPDPDAIAPDLTGYGSRAWLVRFIGNPEHADFYGKRNDRMPLFGEKQILDAKTIGILADWLRGEWYEAPKTAGK
ncbi:MAG: menaquinol-cytochrome C reductase [Pedosphaera sp.]|nr:c-type cytochrome [Pedosphaera sp.]PHX95711.1 MAG: menaquinol-cytochrome C reductase [Pedosphaera sp.]